MAATSGFPLDHSQSDMDTTPVNDVREAFEEHGVGRQYFFRGSCAKNAGEACLLSLSAARRQIRGALLYQICSFFFNIVQKAFVMVFLFSCIETKTRIFFLISGNETISRILFI